MKPIGFILLLSLPQWTHAQLNVTFESLKPVLQKQNARLDNARLVSQASDSRAQGHLVRTFFPELQLYAAEENFKIGSQPDKTQPQAGLLLQMNLFNGGRDSLEAEIRATTSSMRKFQLKRVESEELQKARQIYWELLYTQEQIELLLNTSKMNLQNLNAAERRIRNGVATESDRMEFEMKTVDLKRELEEARLKLKSQKSELAILLGTDDEEIIFGDRLLHDRDFEKLLQHKSEDHDFLYREAELGSEHSRLLARSQQRIWWPRLEAYAAYNQYSEREKEHPDSKDRTETVLGLKLSISLAAGLQSQKESQALALESEGNLKLAKLHRREVDVHLTNEINELRFLHDQVHDSEENIKRAEKYYKLTQSEYVRGVKNSPDVLGASEKLFEMRRKRLEIIRDFQISKAHALSKMGL